MIEYSQVQNSQTDVDDGFSQILKETSEFFASKRIQMVGEGFKDIISEQSLFNSYVDKLTEGLDADEAMQTEALLENARDQILNESTVSGIQPISSLSMPVVRKMWSRVAVKHAFPTEVVKMPKFSISYMEPYIMDENGVKQPLPDAIRDRKDVANKQTLDVGELELPLDDENILAAAGGDQMLGDGVDPEFYISKVTVECLDSGGANAEDVVEEVNIKIDIAENAFGEVSAEHSDGTETTDKLFANMDLSEGILNASSLKGNIQSIEVTGYLESTNNANQESVSFDIKREDITIGTGAHINAPVPVEFLQDTKALYNIDGAATVTDLMSKTVGLKLELELIDFLDESFERTKREGDKYYERTFNALPPSNYSHGPKQWREELKLTIDHLANKMKRDWNFYDGHFVIVGSPLDIKLINNVNWRFKSMEGERGGVDVDFDLGAYAGANKYQIVSTNEIEQGSLRMFFVPKTPKQMTYKYYPYTFTVEEGTYNNPQQTLVPNIMMTKRHTIEELKPICARINVTNNDGSTRTT